MIGDIFLLPTTTATVLSIFLPNSSQSKSQLSNLCHFSKSSQKHGSLQSRKARGYFLSPVHPIRRSTNQRSRKDTVLPSKQGEHCCIKIYTDKPRKLSQSCPSKYPSLKKFPRSPHITSDCPEGSVRLGTAMHKSLPCLMSPC